MPSVVDRYIKWSFSDEMIDILTKAFRVMDDFGIDDLIPDLIDWLSTAHNESREVVYDGFMEKVRSKLSKILDAHRITLTSDATFGDIVDICDMLFQVQHREDYEGIKIALESFDTDESILSRIFAEMSVEDTTYWLSRVEYVDSSTLTALKVYVTDRLPAEKAIDVDVDIYDRVMKNIKLSAECFGIQTFGSQLVDSDVAVAASFQMYLPLVRDELVKLPKKEFALNLLSVFLITDEGVGDLIAMYRKYSEDLLGSLDEITMVEKEFLSCLNKFIEYVKLQDEKDRVSQSGNTIEAVRQVGLDH